MAERAEQHDLATLGYLADLVNLYPPHLSVRVHADMHMHMHVCTHLVPPHLAQQQQQLLLLLLPLFLLVHYYTSPVEPRSTPSRTPRGCAV